MTLVQKVALLTCSALIFVVALASLSLGQATKKQGQSRFPSVHVYTEPLTMTGMRP